MTTAIIYECGICGGHHPWNWDGDCRDDKNNYADETDYAKRTGVPLDRVEVRTTEERLEADAGGPLSAAARFVPS